MQVWKEYKKLFYKENEWSRKFSPDKNKGPCQNLIENNKVEALCRTKVGKTESPRKVTSDLFKAC